MLRGGMIFAGVHLLRCARLPARDSLATARAPSIWHTRRVESAEQMPESLFALGHQPRLQGRRPRSQPLSLWSAALSVTLGHHEGM